MMFSWVRRRRERNERVESKARNLIRAFGLDAYSEARLGQRRAGDEAPAKEWRDVALAISRMTGRRVGLDTATRMAMEADLSRAPQPEPDQLDELRRILDDKRQQTGEA